MKLRIYSVCSLLYRNVHILVHTGRILVVLLLGLGLCVVACDTGSGGSLLSLFLLHLQSYTCMSPAFTKYTAYTLGRKSPPIIISPLMISTRDKKRILYMDMMRKYAGINASHNTTVLYTQMMTNLDSLKFSGSFLFSKANTAQTTSSVRLKASEVTKGPVGKTQRISCCPGIAITFSADGGSNTAQTSTITNWKYTNTISWKTPY